MRTRKILKTLKNRKENDPTYQRTDIQFHVYANRSRRTYVSDFRQLSNPVFSWL